MEWLQTLLDNSSMPILTASSLGLLTALSPCPLATNITAIGFISHNIENRYCIFRNGLLYTLGRIFAYTFLGIILINILKEGTSLFGVQRFISKYSELFIGPALFVIGLFILFSHLLSLPSFGFKGNGERLMKYGGWGSFLLGILFALTFCPTSGMFYFGMLIPMSATSTAGYLLPIAFAIASALPVLLIAWFLAFSVQHISKIYGRMQIMQKCLNIAVGLLFTAVGIYYCIIILL